MPSAKSGSAGSADAPVEPGKAKDAADAKPGDVSSADADPAQTESKQWDQVQVNSASGDGGGGGDEEKSRNHWISIELKDAKGKPIPNEAYEVKASDGTISSGMLDEKGKARIEGIPDGQCMVRFPRLHNSEWRKA